MTRNTPRDDFQALIEGVRYAQELQAVYEQLPRDRCLAFCKRQSAPLGHDIWNFLMSRAEEMEKELNRLGPRGDMENWNGK